MAKKDFTLGLQVQKYLIEKGVETPIDQTKRNWEEGQKEKNIAAYFLAIMRILGLDLEDDSLQDTPQRLGEMYVKELFYGLDYKNFPKCTVVDNKMNFDEMVTIDAITSLSVCEHHFQTIDGKVRISYIPKDKILGLSKFNRVVDFFSRRPQIQERLGLQIYYALSYILNTEDIAVMIDAVHYCVKCRGVQDTQSSTKTTKLGGVFKTPEVRAEFLR